MATFTAYGDNYTIAANPTPSTVLLASKWKGKVRCLSESVTMTTAGSSGTLVYVGKLPANAVPLYTLFQNNDATSTATGIIGYAGDTNALGTISAITTTQEQTVWPTVFNTPLSAAKDVYITTATADTSASTVWKVQIFYSTPD